MTNDAEDMVFSLKDVKFKNILNITELDMERNRVISIVGPSGSGKTTLLRLLNKMISPDEGKILYLGNNLSSYDSIELRRKVVMLAQTPVIFSGTVSENLVIGCKFSEREEPGQDEIKRFLDKVKLEAKPDGDASKLSGGEKQRLALARILLMNPDVLLLDEPSSALDSETEDLIFKVITRFAKDNDKSLIMVTHSEDMARRYAEVLVRIKEGMVKEIEELNDDERDR